MRIDPRAGSGDLYPLLKAKGVRDVEMVQMSYGDVSITGNGPEGCPVMVGIEVKRLEDMIQCIGNGRFVGHQLPGMLASFDQNWLLVEGIWREGKSGIIEVPRGQRWLPLLGQRGMTANALHGFLLTMSIKMGVRVTLTGTRSQTVDWLYQLNRWWTGKEYEEHKAHLTFDNSAAISLVSRPSLVRRVAKELPGIGWDRSANVAKRFVSVVDMCMADRAEWAKIEGIGKVTSTKVVAALEGREGEAE